MCDKMAGTSQQTGYPDFTCDILPTERWAIFTDYPNHRKITGRLSRAIFSSLCQHILTEYLLPKHGLTFAKLSEIDTESLGQALKKMPIHKWANQFTDGTQIIISFTSNAERNP